MDNRFAILTEESEELSQTSQFTPQLERNCLGCQRQISSTSYRCPYCGERKVTIGIVPS